MSLKEKLLDLNIVEDNDYLDKYVELIESNKTTKKEKFKTQGHHVIPVSYYKHKYNLKSRCEAKKYADEDESNFRVNLLFKNHALAHYYLAMSANDCIFLIDMVQAFKCIIHGKMHLKQLSAFTDNVDVLQKLQTLYTESKIYISNYFKGRVALYKDNKQIFVKLEDVDSMLNLGYVKGTLPETRDKIREAISHKIWITDGIKELSINETESIPEGYYKGRITNYFQDRKTEISEKKRRDNISRSKRGTTLSKEVRDKIANTLKFGEKRTSLTKWMNNGKINRRILQSEISKFIESGWQLGKIGKNKPCSESRKQKISGANRNKKFVYKNNVVRSIKIDFLDDYLKQGWKIGNPNLSKAKRGVIHE